MQGNKLTKHKDIEREILDFYRNLVGKASTTLKHVDITALIEGAQLNRDQHDSLTKPVTEEEIWNMVKGLGDNKALGIDVCQPKNAGGLNLKYLRDRNKATVLKIL